jgi:hypothetical protein
MAPLLPLDSFRQAMGLNPWHFWQLANDTIPVASCSDVFYQHSWQATDRAGRGEIAEAMESAEDKLTRLLGYSPIPRYTEKTLEWPRYHDLRVGHYPYSDARGRWVNVQVDAYVQSLGVESLTLISAGTAVVYSDGDGDGLDETFTVTVATTVTDAAELAAYFIAADRLDDELANWRIQPIRVTLSGGNAIIKGNSWLLVKPALYEGASTAELDPDLAANFVTSLAIYRRTTYVAGTGLSDCQSKFIWETQPLPCCCTCNAPTGSSTDPAAVGYAVGRGGIRDSRLGIVTPAEAVYDTATGYWSAPAMVGCWREPDRVLVRMYAGYPLTGGYPDRAHARVLARLIAAELGRPICACEWANKEVARWQVDLARTGGNDDDSYAVSPGDLENPLGTRRGHVEAWRFINDRAIRPTTLI